MEYGYLPICILSKRETLFKGIRVCVAMTTWPKQRATKKLKDEMVF